jgi:hypothetical protein
LSVSASRKPRVAGRRHRDCHAPDLFDRYRHRFGFIAHVVVKLLAGGMSQVSPGLAILAIFFLVRFAIL